MPVPELESTAFTFAYFSKLLPEYEKKFGNHYFNCEVVTGGNACSNEGHRLKEPITLEILFCSYSVRNTAKMINRTSTDNLS